MGLGQGRSNRSIDSSKSFFMAFLPSFSLGLFNSDKSLREAALRKTFWGLLLGLTRDERIQNTCSRTEVCSSYAEHKNNFGPSIQNRHMSHLTLKKLAPQEKAVW